MVQRKRHLAKALTYRVFGSAGTAAIAFIVTGDAKIGAAVGIADSIIKITLYYIHERIWYRIPWGVKHTEAPAPEPATPAPQIKVVTRSVWNTTPVPAHQNP